MADYSKDVKKLLEAAGGNIKRQPRGSHEIWYITSCDKTISVPAKIRSKHTANKCLTDAGLSKEF